MYSFPAGPGQRPWARKPGKKKKHDKKKNHQNKKKKNKKNTRAKEHSAIVMFPYIPMSLCSMRTMRTFN